jgi:hypothetical protein
MSKPRLLIHIGVPKSGTTSLQFGAFPTHPEIRYIGKPFYDAQIGYEASLATAQLCDSLWKQDDLEFDPDLARHNFDIGIQPRLGARLTVVSEEGLSAASASDRHLTAQRLASLCKECDCKILITIREQKSALFSLNNWYYARCLTSLKFNRWIEWCSTYSSYYGCHNDFPLRQYRYAGLYERYANLFGPESVLVLPVEHLAHNPSKFYAELEDFLGIKRFWMTEQCPKLSIENRSLGRIGIRYQRLVKSVKALSKSLGARAALTSEALELDGFHGHFMEIINYCDRPMPTMRCKTARILDDYYREDNIRLCKMVRRDLRCYGYAV